MANSAADIQKLYIAYFNRPADPAGLAYWMASSANLTTIAKSFADQPEYAKAYAGQERIEVISTIYKNLFGSDRVVDVPGLLYWDAQVASGKLTMGEVAISILGGATGADKIAVDSKVVAATSFTTAIDTAAEMVAYSKSGGTDLAKSWLGSVTTAATATSQIAAQDAVIKSIVDGSVSSNVLTNGTDILSGSSFSAPQVYTPGGDDRINSLQDEDQLTGTGTNNVLNATLGNAGDNGATTITPKLNNIQVVNASFTGSGTDAVQNLDLQDATGVKEVNITRVTAVSNTARIENVQSVLEKMSITNSNSNNAGVVEFSFGTDVLKGDNTGTLNLSNVQLGTINVGGNVATGASGVTGTSYETLTLNSTGASNTVSTLNLPMDTGTTGKLIITGDKSLNLSSSTVINSALVTSNVEAMTYAGGVAGANGRLSAIDASALTGDLTLHIGTGTFSTGKADTSGANQDVTITGGKGNDTFYLADTIGAGDSLTGGDGTDTLVIVAGGNVNTSSSIITKVESVSVMMNGASSTVNFDKLPDATGVTVRNIGNNGTSGATMADVAFTLSNLTAVQGAAVTVLHSTTGNGDVTQTTVNANLKAAGTAGIKISDGVNTDGKFNFTLNTSNAASLVIDDADTESNIVELGSSSAYTGSITVKGGTAGKVINFDVDTAAAAGSTTGLLRQNVGQGANASGAVDVAALATQVRIVAATFDASAEASDVIARFSTNAASLVGAQSIKTGAGNDTVIFDALNDNRAGLTISDSVDGGAGTDTLVIDGNLGVPGVIALGASEWTNVSNFETIRLVNAGAGSSYSLTLTDTLITKNNLNGALTITNDNDTANDATGAADTAGVSNESAVVIDARALNNTSKFNYNGEEGASRTNDRIIMSDVNLNGTHNLNGGAADNSSSTFAANADILEIRNTAVATLGDLANIRNFGQISFNNDQAVAQTLTLQLDAAVVDALVDSYHTASVAERESLTIRANDASFASVAGAALDIDATALGDAVNLVVVGDTLVAGANDIVRLTASASSGAHNINLGTGVVDKIAFSGGAAATTISATIGGNITVTQGVNNVTHTASNYETLDLSGFAGVGTLVSGGVAGFSFIGTALADTIASGAFAGTIDGGAGIDAITLNAGTVQTVIVGNTAASADNITTFTTTEDKIQISKALFAALTSTTGAGFSVAAEFTIGAMVGAVAQLNYNAGVLSYDADGTGAGAAIIIANLVGAPALVAGDFAIVA